MNNVLVTGGAGYKGTVLVDALLKKGLHVTILDNFMYGFEPVLGFAQYENFHVLKKDIRNITADDVKQADVIYHLAGISGYPACEANPHSAQTINVESTRKLMDLLSKDQIVVFASTTSMYGREGVEQDEAATPSPTSLYGRTKVEGEHICLQHPSAVSFRFATVFGVSRKMRTDLLLNDFVYKAVTERSIILFDANSVRTFVHVRDAIKAYLMVIEMPEKMIGQIFNVGSNTLNCSKMDIALHIKNQLPDIEIVNSSLDDPDRRDFIINFDKISALGYRAEISIEDGITELIRLYSWFRHYSPFSTI
jgi:nucleoside-diphosphate-sugar epimerase